MCIRDRLWHDYGPTLAVEELAEEHGIAISRETLRQWLIEAKLWRARVVQEMCIRDSLLSAPFGPKSVTHVSGTFCYLCLGTDTTAEMQWRSPLTQASVPQKSVSNFPQAFMVYG